VTDGESIYDGINNLVDFFEIFKCKNLIKDTTHICDTKNSKTAGKLSKWGCKKAASELPRHTIFRG